MVEKRFEKLGMPDIERFENYLPTAFNSELTLLQKVNKIIFDLIESNKLTNEMIDYLNKFIEKFDEKLYKTIEDVLQVWLEDGLLAEVVRDAINEEVIEARIGYDSLKDRLDTESTEVNKQLNIKQTIIDSPFDIVNYNAKIGETIQTKKFYNSLGASLYEVKSTGDENNLTIFKTKNNLFAHLVITPKMFIEQFGAEEYPTNSDNSFELAVKNIGLELNLTGKYSLDNKLIINNEIFIIGNNDAHIYTNKGIEIINDSNTPVTLENFSIFNEGVKNGNIGVYWHTANNGWGSRLNAKEINVGNFYIGFKGLSTYASHIKKCYAGDCVIGYELDGHGVIFSNNNIFDQTMSLNNIVGYNFINATIVDLIVTTAEGCQYAYLIDRLSNNIVFNSSWVERTSKGVFTYGTYNKNTDQVILNEINNSVTFINTRFLSEENPTATVHLSTSPYDNAIYPVASNYGDLDSAKRFFAEGLEYKNYGTDYVGLGYNSGGVMQTAYQKTPFGEKNVATFTGITGGFYVVCGHELGKYQLIKGNKILVKQKIWVNKETLWVPHFSKNIFDDSPENNMAKVSSSYPLLKKNVWNTVSYMVELKEDPIDIDVALKINFYNHSGSLDFKIIDTLVVNISEVFGSYETPSVQSFVKFADYFTYHSKARTSLATPLPNGGTDAQIPYYKKVPMFTTYWLTDQNKLIIRLETGWFTVVDNIFVSEGA